VAAEVQKRTAAVPSPAVPGGTAVVAGAVVAVAAEAAVVAVEAGGNHDYFTIVFRQKLHGGENDVFLYKRWNSKHAAFFHDCNSGGIFLSFPCRLFIFHARTERI
jgi:hypothetical protein